MIMLRCHETGDWFLENSHLCHLGTTRQGAEASWLTDEHSVVELHADQHRTVGFPSLLGTKEVHHITNHDLCICVNEREGRRSL
jgi:hypothetical protein